jgi:hypothetical protein
MDLSQIHKLSSKDCSFTEWTLSIEIEEKGASWLEILVIDVIQLFPSSVAKRVKVVQNLIKPLVWKVDCIFHDGTSAFPLILTTVRVGRAGRVFPTNETLRFIPVKNRSFDCLRNKRNGNKTQQKQCKSMQIHLEKEVGEFLEQENTQRN